MKLGTGSSPPHLEMLQRRMVLGPWSEVTSQSFEQADLKIRIPAIAPFGNTNSPEIRDPNGLEYRTELGASFKQDP